MAPALAGLSGYASGVMYRDNGACSVGAVLRVALARFPFSPSVLGGALADRVMARGGRGRTGAHVR